MNIKKAGCKYEEALAIFRRIYGPEYITGARTLEDLAEVIDEPGDSSHALFTEAREIGATEADIPSTVSSFGYMYHAVGQHEEARPFSFDKEFDWHLADTIEKTRNIPTQHTAEDGVDASISPLKLFLDSIRNGPISQDQLARLKSLVAEGSVSVIEPDLDGKYTVAFLLRQPA